MVFLWLSCILLQSGDIELPPTEVDDSNLLGPIPVADTGTDSSWSEGVMPSHLKLYTFPPDSACLETRTQDIWLDFESMSGCTFFPPDSQNLLYQAYDAQTLSFDLPEVICGAEVSFGTLGTGAFDDHIALEMNGQLLYASDVNMAGALSFSNGFDWDLLFGAPMVAELDPYCFLGCDDVYDNQSEWGVTFYGNMGVEFHSEDMVPILLQQSDGVARVYAFGDDDPEDCLLDNFSLYLQLIVPLDLD